MVNRHVGLFRPVDKDVYEFRFPALRCKADFADQGDGGFSIRLSGQDADILRTLRDILIQTFPLSPGAVFVGEPQQPIPRDEFVRRLLRLASDVMGVRP